MNSVRVCARTLGAVGLHMPAQVHRSVPVATCRSFSASSADAASADIPYLPNVEYISSVQNGYIKHCVRVRTNRKYREKERRTLLCGLDVINEQLQASSDRLEVVAVFKADNSALPGRLTSGDWPIYEVSPHVMHKLAGLEDTSGLGAVAEIVLPSSASKLAQDPVTGESRRVQRILVLEGVQDPGNLGTLIRTAAGLNWDAVFLLNGCCDPYNEKAMRAARGATFQIEIMGGTMDQMFELVKEQGLPLVAAATGPKLGSGGATATQISPGLVDDLSNLRVALALGSEGQGLTTELQSSCRPVSIPMSESIDSLNVGVAGSMLMLVLSNALQPVLSSMHSELCE